MFIKKCVNVFATYCIFLSIAPSACHSSSEFGQPLKPCLPFIADQQIAFVYLTSGNLNLLSGRYDMALTDFQKTISLLNIENDPSTDTESTKFLALFGSVIACDNLNLGELCVENILSLRTLMNEYEGSSPDSSFDFSPSNEINQSFQLRDMIYLSKSREVCFALSDIISELSLDSNHITIQPAKSLSRRVEKFAHNVERAWRKFINLVHDTLDEYERIFGKPNNEIENKNV